MENILITTQHRGVFFAKIDSKQLEEYKQKAVAEPSAPKHLIDLKNCRMAIYFGTSGGVAQLASDGPTTNSRIGSPADLAVLHDVTAVFHVSDQAAEKWLRA